MFRKIIHAVTNISFNRKRKLLLEKIDAALFNIKGFYVKELFLADDNQTAIAIDSTFNTLNLISIEQGKIKTCLIRFTDLLSIKLIKDSGNREKVSRNAGLKNEQINTIGELDISGFPKDEAHKSAIVLYLNTTKSQHPCFVIDFQQKQKQLDTTSQNTKVKCLSEHWFEMCENIIIKGELKAEEARYRNTINDFKLPEEVVV